jgi:hypothetical protein
VEPRTDTGATLLTRENLEDPKLRQLLNPELDKWLGK